MRLAAALVRAGDRVAMIAYGTEAELPCSVDGVTVVPRQYRKKQFRLVGKLLEAVVVWRSLWRAPSRTIVTRCAGIQVGLVGVYARLARRRLVHATASVLDFDLMKVTASRRDRFLYQLGMRLADAIVVQTEEQVELCRSTFGRTPVLVKSIAAAVEAAGGEPVAFLWVGRLASYKRPLEYVELARALPEAKLWMVGVAVPKGSKDETVAHAVAAAAAELPNLELLAPRSHAEIGELMSHAVASVNTADFEGMPNVLLEAWSRGVPALVLTHDPGGVISAHGLGGFAHGARDALVMLAREQWETRKQREELSQRCRAYVAQHHAGDIVVAQWRQVLSMAASECRITPSPAETELTCAG